MRGIKLLLISFILGLIVFSCNYYVPKQTYDISRNNVLVEAGSYVYFEVNLGYVTDVEIYGNFYAIGGSGDDIKFWIIKTYDIDNFLYDNGDYEIIYSSGQQHSSSFDVYDSYIDWDESYYIVLDNSFSIISDKYVNFSVTFEYSE